jgi:hypothetical protein
VVEQIQIHIRRTFDNLAMHALSGCYDRLSLYSNSITSIWKDLGIHFSYLSLIGDRLKKMACAINFAQADPAGRTLTFNALKEVLFCKAWPLLVLPQVEKSKT